MKYVFGPVPSRRLGQSLGIDTIPLKTCNWNCIYCQLGRTRPLTNDRKVYIPCEDILAEVKSTLASHTSGEIDWITFVGSGEPTLHSEIGYLIDEIKTLTNIPVAVITNGSLLYLPEVRADLSAADVILPSLDSGNAILYRKLNRPHGQATFERLVDGLIAFSEKYQGKLWVEVMLIEGWNDSEAALREIVAILERVEADEVHLLLPTRPPAESTVRPTDKDGLLRARAILGEAAKVVHPASGRFDLSGTSSLEEAIIGIITRHPMQEGELNNALKRCWSSTDVEFVLDSLLRSGQAQIITRYGVRFWSGIGAYYQEANQS
ncbi:MAG: radical SAM protein [Anaerolineae bacterium]|nr:radical SAM protein [Anaerolineae bacterium]MBT7189876.1 radical SAM protein [Anaerolineae bacterium]MBT7991676.1 radical SAM protein [Anaerolineae bacterium]